MVMPVACLFTNGNGLHTVTEGIAVPLGTEILTLIIVVCQLHLVHPQLPTYVGACHVISFQSRRH